MERPTANWADSDYGAGAIADYDALYDSLYEQRMDEMKDDAYEVAQAIFEQHNRAYKDCHPDLDASFDDLARSEVLVLANDRLDADNGAFERAAIRYFWQLRKQVMVDENFESRCAKLTQDEIDSL